MRPSGKKKGKALAGSAESGPLSVEEVKFMEMVWELPIEKQMILMQELFAQFLDGVDETLEAGKEHRAKSGQEVRDLKVKVAAMEKTAADQMAVLERIHETLAKYDEKMKRVQKETDAKMKEQEEKYQLLVRKTGMELPFVVSRLESALGTLDAGSEKAVRGVEVLKNGLVKVTRDLRGVAASFQALPPPGVGAGGSQVTVQDLGGTTVQEEVSERVEPEQVVLTGGEGAVVPPQIGGTTERSAPEELAAGSSTVGAGLGEGRT